MTPCLWELAETQARRAPDRVMAVDEQGGTLTFAGYVARAEQVSGVLAERGIGRGSVVSWTLPTSVEATILAGALARLGAVQNPMLPTYGLREMRFIVDQAGTEWLLVPPADDRTDFPALATDLVELAGERDRLRTLVLTDEVTSARAAIVPPAAPPPARGTVRWIFYTSGTTGAPRGAQHADETLIASAHGMAERIGIRAADRNTMVFPFTHIGGVVWLAVSFLTGMSNVFVARFDAADTPRLLTERGVTLVGSGSAFLLAYVQAQRSGGQALFGGARVFMAGGAPKPDGLLQALHDTFGDIPLVSGYGMTEAPLVAFSAVADPEAQRATTEGRASAGAVIRAVRPDGTPCAAGESGELQVKGEQVMLGYVDPSDDAAAFDPEGWLRTGDLGHVDDEGYVLVTGRLKDVIIRKGENISAKELEDLLFEHPKVEDVAVVGLPDPVTGERACAVCVLAPGAGTLTLTEVTDHLVERQLMRQKLPERLEIVDALPRNASGKVLKADLRERWA